MKRRAFLLASLLGLAHTPASLGNTKPKLPSCAKSKTLKGWQLFWKSNYYSIKPPLYDFEAYLPFKSSQTLYKEPEVKFIKTNKNTYAIDFTSLYLGTRKYYDDVVLHVDGKKIYHGLYKTIKSEKGSRTTIPVIPLNVIEKLAKGKVCHILSHDKDRVKIQAKFKLKDFSRIKAVAEQGRRVAKQDKAAKKCSEGCFITTAVCQHVGLDDNCFELTQLRQFRDTYMATDNQRQQAVHHYYLMAPSLCQKLTPKQHMKLYWGYILPCALLASCKLNALTYRHYQNMMTHLQQKFIS